MVPGLRRWRLQRCKDLSETSIFSAMRNVNDSNDSVLGMIASNLFNKFLIAVLNLGVKDITSGFIIGKKEVLMKNHFNSGLW